MIILGIDPGTLITGYGIIDTDNRRFRVLTCGAIKNDSKTSLPLRLKVIFNQLTSVIKKYHPDEFAIETAFYGKNAQSALKLGHARGVAMLAAVAQEIPVQEYSPLEVKKAIVGNGRASKEQVQYMVKSLLRLKHVPNHYDITDALAVAICHSHRSAKPRKAYTDWKSYIATHPSRISKTSQPKVR